MIDIAKKKLKPFRNLINNEYQIEQNYQDRIITPLGFPAV